MSSPVGATMNGDPAAASAAGKSGKCVRRHACTATPGRGYSTAPTEAANRDTVCVGRIREDLPPNGGLNLWIVVEDAYQAVAISVLPALEALSFRAQALASRAI